MALLSMRYLQAQAGRLQASLQLLRNSFQNIDGLRPDAQAWELLCLVLSALNRVQDALAATETALLRCDRSHHRTLLRLKAKLEQRIGKCCSFFSLALVNRL